MSLYHDIVDGLDEEDDEPQYHPHDSDARGKYLRYELDFGHGRSVVGLPHHHRLHHRGDFHLLWCVPQEGLDINSRRE